MSSGHEGASSKKAARKRNLDWMRGFQGAQKLRRAQEHRRRQQSEGNFGLLEDEKRNSPEWMSSPRLSQHYSVVSDLYIGKDRNLVSRACSFLLQLMIFLVRGWTGPSAAWTRKFGKGLDTAPRRALAWHHEHMMRENHVLRCTRADRVLFRRAVQDKDKADELLTTLVYPEDVPLEADDECGLATGASSSAGGSLAKTISLKKETKGKLYRACCAGHFPWPPLWDWDVDKLWTEFEEKYVWEAALGARHKSGLHRLNVGVFRFFLRLEPKPQRLRTHINNLCTMPMSFTRCFWEPSSAFVR